jgi:hypothetical protein
MTLAGKQVPSQKGTILGLKGRFGQHRPKTWGQRPKAAPDYDEKWGK